MPETYSFSVIWLIVALVCFPLVSRAGHIVGGEVAYTCQGWKDDDPTTGIKIYDIRINMYRDNIGQGAYFDGVNGGAGGQGPQGNFSAQGNYTIYRGNTIFRPTEPLSLGPVMPVDLNLGNPCLVLTEPADQQIGVYEFTIELPVSDQPYTISYQRCCRNEAIRNLARPKDIGTTYFIEITAEAQRRCNASPRFNIDPPIAICVNEAFQLDFGATDREGDSLAYKLCTPVVGGGNDAGGASATPTPFDDVAPRIESPPPYASARWVSNRYNTNNQLGRDSELEVDVIMGLLTGRPTSRGTFALAVCVEEWALDTTAGTRFLISETKREFQLIVNLCGDRVMADLVETSIDELGRFYIKQCGFGEQVIVNESTDEAVIDTYSWRLEGPDGTIRGSSRDLVANINRRGLYEGQMILNQESFSESCKDTASFLIEVFPGIDVDFDNTESLCEDVSIDFTSFIGTQGRNFITDINWDLGDTINTADSREAFTYLYTQPGRYDVTLSVTDNNNCSDSLVKEVVHFPTANTVLVPPDSSFGCAPYTRFFENNSRPVSDEYSFEWRFGDGGSSNEREPTYEYNRVGIFDVYLKITSPIGCEVDTLLPDFIDARQSPTAGFAILPEELSVLNPDFSIRDQSRFTGAWRYAVRDATGASLFRTFQPTFDYTLRDTSTLSITQIVLNPSGCVDSLTKSVNYTRFVSTFFLPTAFTPNGDGLNDLFVPVGLLDDVTDYRFSVWDRYGERLFTTDDPTAGWDGSHEGTSSPGGGYLWNARYIDPNGRRQRHKGGVNLLR